MRTSLSVNKLRDSLEGNSGVSENALEREGTDWIGNSSCAYRILPLPPEKVVGPRAGATLAKGEGMLRPGIWNPGTWCSPLCLPCVGPGAMQAKLWCDAPSETSGRMGLTSQAAGKL